MDELAEPPVSDVGIRKSRKGGATLDMLRHAISLSSGCSKLKKIFVLSLKKNSIAFVLHKINLRFFRFTRVLEKKEMPNFKTFF